MCRTPLLRRHPVSFTGLAFATTGRPLGLHPEVLALAAKRQLHTTDDDTVLLVHRPFTPSSLHDYTTLPPSLTPPRRVYFPIDAPVGSALIPRNHLISRGRFSDTQHAYALLVLDPHGHLHPLVATTASSARCSRLRTKQLSGLRFPFRYRTAPTFSSASTLRPFTHHTPGQLLRTPFHRPRQPPRRHVRHY